MTDLYNIPNDDGVRYRLDKFVEYQHEVPSIHYRFMTEYIRRHGFDSDTAIRMCWYMACIYNELGCAMIQRMFQEGASVDDISETLWDIPVNSAKKHVRYCGRFKLLIDCFEELTCGHPSNWLKRLDVGSETDNYTVTASVLTMIPECSRFSADLFLECACDLGGYIGFNAKEPTSVDWDKGANLTSGLFNIFYEDEKALRFERNHRVSRSDKTELSRMLESVSEEISRTYPEQDSTINKFVGKICSFRNLFKAKRYGGYHHDRQLEQIRALPDDFSWLAQEAYEIRSDIFSHRFLGELNGWNGIRKERKRLWLDKGLTGVE